MNGQRGGNLPEHTYFDKYYTKKGWKVITIRSLSVGQGEIELTPLQMANVVSIFANRGYYYSPHIVKSIGSDKKKNTAFIKRQETGYPSSLFEKVIDGMELVYEGIHGSARHYKSDSITMCGKTGTVENPHGKSHSVFIAFAPVDNPKIAIAVIVENSGYGSLWAAPIASLMMKKYLLGEIESSWYEDKMLNTNLIKQD